MRSCGFLTSIDVDVFFLGGTAEMDAGGLVAKTTVKAVFFCECEGLPPNMFRSKKKRLRLFFVPWIDIQYMSMS